MELLLETVLRNAHAEDYIDDFKRHNIDASILPQLSNEDLQVFGIDDPKIREAILEKAATLEVPLEKKSHPVVTKKNAVLVLNQISHQLDLHHALLSYALMQKKMVVCALPFRDATRSLLHCITSFENELNEYEKKFASGNEIKRKGARKMFILAGTSVLALFILGRLIKSYV